VHAGGELQRFAIAISCVQVSIYIYLSFSSFSPSLLFLSLRQPYDMTPQQEGDIYMFDEPSSYLDVRQRIRAARSIRELCEVRIS
jgi:translation initiation factor RLI1